MGLSLPRPENHTLTLPHPVDQCLTYTTLIQVNSWWLQIEVRAFDGGFPSKPSARRATINVKVIRNKNAPTFVGAPYDATIRMDKSLASRVAQVVARDNDPKVRIGSESFIYI